MDLGSLSTIHRADPERRCKYSDSLCAGESAASEAEIQLSMEILLPISFYVKMTAQLSDGDLMLTKAFENLRQSLATEIGCKRVSVYG